MLIRWLKSHHHGWLKDIIAPLTPRYGEIAIASLFANLLALAVPIFTLQVYDRVVTHNGTSTLVALLIGVSIALAFDFFLRLARSRMLQHAALHIDAHLGRRLYDKLASLPLQTLEGRPASYWQSLFTDTQLIRNVFSGPTAILVVDLPFVLIFLAVIFVIATPIAWVLLIIIPAFLALTYISAQTQDVATAKERWKGLHREGLLAELISGRATVKALLIDQTAKPDWENLHAAAISEAHSRGQHTDFFVTAGQSLMMLTTVALVSLGALAIIDKEMTFGALIATNMLVGKMIAPLNQLIGQWKAYASCTQAISRIDRLMHLESERQVSGLDRERPAGEITAEKLHFHYREDVPILTNVSIRFQPGQMIGLVGRNGSGKTSFIKCLQGLYAPTDGRILLDGNDIKQFTRSQLARWIGYVPQECFLFEGSIRDNIAKSKPDASDDAILQASQWAGADDFIKNLPDGYATEIGERGCLLSGGQRQRIAIARALLQNPPVLLLDEVTSNLDSESEQHLASILSQLAQERCIILATHSLPLLNRCSHLVVMDKGQISISGPAKEVLPRITGSTPQGAR